MKAGVDRRTSFPLSVTLPTSTRNPPQFLLWTTSGGDKRSQSQ
jgi:hypothetical protein